MSHKISHLGAAHLMFSDSLTQKMKFKIEKENFLIQLTDEDKLDVNVLKRDLKLRYSYTDFVN